MKRGTSGRFLFGLLVYVAATIFLVPLAAHYLPHPGTPQTTESALAEIATAPKSAPLQLIIEPRDGVAPIAKAIRDSKKSLDLVIYELQDESIEKALVQAEDRGISVRVLLENLNSFGRHPNQAAYDFLQEKGVPVHWAPDYFALTHQKTLIVDGSTAYIMTFNLQPQYYATSRDFGLIDTDQNDVDAIAQAFDSDWNARQEVANRGDDLVWSPGSETVLLALIANASSTLDIYNEEMADPNITEALEAAAARGVSVRVVMTYATNWKSDFNELVQNGVHVRTFASTAKKIYIHAKAIIADDREAFVGSENFSRQSLSENRELGILLTRPDIISELEATFARDYQNARPYSVRK